jgi:hypothetical protein
MEIKIYLNGKKIETHSILENDLYDSFELGSEEMEKLGVRVFSVEVYHNYVIINLTDD